MNKQTEQLDQATNFTTPPAALILALPEHISKSNRGTRVTYSAFSDTYRASTIIGMLGSLATLGLMQRDDSQL